MNLLDCSVPYFLTVPAVLALRPRALRTVLDIHSGYLEAAAVPARMRHELGPLVLKVKAQTRSFMLPANLDYSKLSHAATKALIACYWKSKRSRTPYRITLTREQLAEHAQLSARHLRKALIELQKKRLVHIKQIWRKGIQVSLLDPEYESGTALYDIAEFNRMRLNTVPAFEWYRLLLHDKSVPMETRRPWEPGDRDYVVQECPFCGRSKTFRVTLIQNDTKSGYDKDMWHCHGCKRGGDSKRLWGLLHYYIDRKDWRDALQRKS